MLQNTSQTCPKGRTRNRQEHADTHAAPVASTLAGRGEEKKFAEVAYEDVGGSDSTRFRTRQNQHDWDITPI